jgi:Tn7-like transposition protein D/TniQ
MDWLPPPNLPILLGDETLYSWAGAVHAQNASADVRQTSHQLFGKPFAALLHDFPSHLSNLDEAVGGALGPTIELALRHTLLGYFLPTIPATFSSTILNKVCSGSYSTLKFKLGIAASQVGGYHPLKACRLCLEEDERFMRRKYWRVQHQYPSALVCTRHRCGLLMTWDRITPVHQRRWILPSLGPDLNWVEIPESTELQLNRLHRVAEYSSRWANLEPGSLSPRALAATYRAAFSVRGMVTSKGRLRLGLLTELLRSHFDGFEHFPGFATLSSVRAEWPGLAGSLVRTMPRSGHPLKHLLLISMLFETWDSFLRLYVEQANRPEADTPRAIAAIDRPTMDTDRFTQLVQARGMSISAAARELGVTPSTGVRWAKVLGIDFTGRAKTLTPERLSSIRSLLRTGADRTEVCKTCGISAASLNRLLSSEKPLAMAWRAARHEAARQSNRAAFTATVAAHPGWSVKQLRTAPGNGYMWLYRHDRDWLQLHLPALWLPQSQEAPAN